MQYLGGKMRQSREIVKALNDVKFTEYVEPFCGALWSATSIIKTYPGRRYILNDKNPYLMCFWREARNGWNPPERVTEATYKKYNATRPVDDPMTGYVGFAWSFGGKFFGGAARTNGKIKGSYKSTRDKIDVLRSADVEFRCGDYVAIPIPAGAAVYLDPPYEGRTPQAKINGSFDKAAYLKWASSLVHHAHVVLATEFIKVPGWELLHDYGDTVVRHLNAKPKDGTRELLMRAV